MSRNTPFFLGIIGFFIILFIFIPNKLAATEQTAPTSVTVINPLGLDILLTAIPEKRIANVVGHPINRSTILNIKVYNAGALRTNPANIVFEITTTTNDAGVSNIVTLTDLDEGNYDILAKGYSHLSKLKSNIAITAYTEIDMTNGGAAPLKAGDINLTAGDDEVNALDIAILVDRWNLNNSRADLNQDTTVNSLDASALLDNFALQGD